MRANIDKIIANSLKKTDEMVKQLQSIEDKFNLKNVFDFHPDDDGKAGIYLLDGEEVTR